MTTKKQDISVDDWGQWIKVGLKEKLGNEFEILTIISEADLQSSVCSFLREKLAQYGNTDWRVLNQPPQWKDQESNVIRPDILITFKGERKIAMELKQSVARKNLVPFSKVLDDVRKLGEYCQDTEIFPYLIWTCCEVNTEKSSERKTELENKASEYENAPEIIIFDLLKEIDGYSKVLQSIISYSEEISTHYE
jgi:hypothetical protein